MTATTLPPQKANPKTDAGTKEQKPDAPKTFRKAPAHEDVHAALAAVKKEVPYILKEKTAGSGKYAYKYAGEADLLAKVRPAMTRHRLNLFPIKVVPSDVRGYPSSEGRVMNRVVAVITYRLHHIDSKTCIEIEVGGEGADIGDKAFAKAMTAAHKTALRQVFTIEMGTDPDKASSENHPNVGHKPALEALKKAPGLAHLENYRTAYLERDYEDWQLKELDAAYELRKKQIEDHRQKKLAEQTANGQQA